LSDQNYIVATAQGKTLYTKPSDSIIGANSDDYYKFYFNSSYTGAYVEGRIIGANSEEGDPVVEVREDDYVILKPNDYIVENGRINKICNASYWRTLQWTNNTFPI
jgi:hypothetical protein